MIELGHDMLLEVLGWADVGAIGPIRETSRALRAAMDELLGRPLIYERIMGQETYGAKRRNCLRLMAHVGGDRVDIVGPWLAEMRREWMDLALGRPENGGKILTAMWRFGGTEATMEAILGPLKSLPGYVIALHSDRALDYIWAAMGVILRVEEAICGAFISAIWRRGFLLTESEKLLAMLFLSAHISGPEKVEMAHRLCPERSIYRKIAGIIYHLNWYPDSLTGRIIKILDREFCGDLCRAAEADGGILNLCIKWGAKGAMKHLLRTDGICLSGNQRARIEAALESMN